MRALIMGTMAACLMAMAGAASADKLIYTITGDGSGSIDGNSFTDTPFTITAVGSSSNEVNGGFFVAINPLASMTFDVSGVTTDSASLPVQIGLNTGIDVVFLSNAVDNDDFYDFSINPPSNFFSTFGPTPGSQDFSEVVATDDGAFVLDNASNLELSTGSAVPEPQSWVMTLLGAGLAGAALRHRRGRVLA
jgi:PEP-CTERM motif